jgi:transposase
MSGNQIKKLKEVDAKELFDDPYLVLAAQNSISVMGFLKERIMVIEKAVTSKIKVRYEFEALQTIPGVGKILALTIMLEVGDINRFPKVGDYSSYCRCVKSGRFSNGKKKGKGNKKNGNKFLAWAYIETANFARRYCTYAQKFYQRKEAKTNGLVAIKALSNKMTRASYYIMRDQVEYDPGKLFG